MYGGGMYGGTYGGGGVSFFKRGGGILSKNCFNSSIFLASYHSGRPSNQTIVVLSIFIFSNSCKV